MGCRLSVYGLGVVFQRARTPRIEFASAVSRESSGALRAGFRVQGSEFRVQGSGFRVCRLGDQRTHASSFDSDSSSLLLSSLELSDTQVYEHQIRALLGTADPRLQL